MIEDSIAAPETNNRTPTSALPPPDAPAAPTNPVLSTAGIWNRSTPTLPSVLSAGQARFTTSGRMALALGLKLMGIGKGDEVLVPAYHCPSMVEPILWSGAGVRFYRLRPDLSVQMDDLDRRVSAGTRALMVTHFLGFPQDMPSLRAFCDDRGLMLIEDCAHSFFGGTKEFPVGSYGDFAIASLMKFFPVYDGGCLILSCHSLDAITLESPGTNVELRSVFTMLERAIDYGRLPLFGLLLKGPLALKEVLWSRLKRRLEDTKQQIGAPSASDGGSGFDPAWVHKRMSRFSSLVLGLASASHNVERRRRNYAQLTAAFDEVPGCRALFPTLPENVAPYAFPLIVDSPDPLFWNLRRQGLPLLRWEQLSGGVHEDGFPVSTRLSRQLYQIPCHQELTPEELRWMVERIRAGLRGA